MKFSITFFLVSLIFVGTKSTYIFTFDGPYDVYPLPCDYDSNPCTVTRCSPGYYIQPADGYYQCCDTCVPYGGPRLDCSMIECKPAFCRCDTYLQPADGINTCCSVCVNPRDIGQYCDSHNPCYSHLACSDNVCYSHSTHCKHNHRFD